MNTPTTNYWWRVTFTLEHITVSKVVFAPDELAAKNALLKRTAITLGALDTVEIVKLPDFRPLGDKTK